MKVGIQSDSGMQPRYAYRGDAGCDLKAAEPFEIAPGDRKLVPCGIRIALPENHVGYVMPRSGIALKHGVTVLNAPGVIDSGYRGEVHALLINHGNDTFHAEKGDRIAQLIVQEVKTAQWIPSKLDDTERGEGGFGSSGIIGARHLTHTESDSWERIDEDAENVAKLFDGFDADASEDIRDIVRRAKALAERG